LQPQCLGLLVGATDKLFDLPFVVGQEWIDVVLIEQASSLGLGKNEVAEEEESDPAIEGEPGENFAVSF
jgi:hypothetical protein